MSGEIISGHYNKNDLEKAPEFWEVKDKINTFNFKYGGCSLMVEHEPVALKAGVRFSSSAYEKGGER